MAESPVDLVRELIRNACVNDGSIDSGHEHRSVETLVEYFANTGEVFEPAPGRQSVVYRVPGSVRGAPSLALICHLDVVPVDRRAWSVDPFAGELADGIVWGRGAVDMLNLTAGMAAAFRPFLHGEKSMAGDLIFIALADEENGGEYGARYVVEDAWDRVKADYALCEVAYPALPGRMRSPLPVVVGEKGSQWSLLSAWGTPGHGSAPYLADNAIATIVEALSGITSADMPVMLDTTWVGLVDALDIEEKLKADLKDPERLDEALEDLAALDPALARYAHAVTHLTVSPNTIGGGTKTNVIADQARVTVDIRTPIDIDRIMVEQYLRKAMGSVADRVEIEPILDQEATASKTPNLLWDAIGDAAEVCTGTRDLVPIQMSGFTDGRFWRQRGAIVHGVGLFDQTIGFSEFLGLFHGNDERVSAASIDMTAKLLGKTIEAFGLRSRAVE